MKSFFSFGFFIIIYSIVLIFSLCFFIPVFLQYGNVYPHVPNNSSLSLNISNNNLVWPIPGFTHINSGFGYRKAPTSGASFYHGGIDIGAPQRYKYNCM